jgi:hypothetical protein
MAFGVSATFASSTQRNIVIGETMTANHNRNILIGLGITSAADNQCVIGNNITGVMTDYVLGPSAAPIASPYATTLRLSDELGADQAGVNFTIRPGLGTGNANPGQLIFNIGAKVGGSSSTLQTAFPILTLDGTQTEARVLVNAPTGQPAVIRMGINAAFAGLIGISSGAGVLTAGSAANETCIITNTQRLLLSLDGGASTAITFTTGGIQTFEKDRAVRFNNQTSAAGAGAGTLANAPAAGNPTHWLKINIGGTNFAIPCWPA